VRRFHPNFTQAITKCSLIDNGEQLPMAIIYQWYNLNAYATYSNTTTNTLTITSVTNAMNGFKYRVQLNKTGNSMRFEFK
jgi:hypothetical protein